MRRTARWVFLVTLAVTVRYALSNDNELRIDYSAISDKDTIINLTNHTYFNLAGAGNGTVLDQVTMINADKITPVDRTLIPTGELLDVKGTPFDFTKPMAIGARIHSDNEQLKNAEPKQGGYDHNWVFNNPGDLNALPRKFPIRILGGQSRCTPVSQECNSILVISWMGR